MTDKCDFCQEGSTYVNDQIWDKLPVDFKDPQAFVVCFLCVFKRINVFPNRKIRFVAIKTLIN